MKGNIKGIYPIKKELGWKPLMKIGKSMSDLDKDGFPSAIDCSDRNPRKQGIISWAVSKIKRKPYQEVEAERYESSERRHQWRLKRLRYQQEELEARKPIIQARAEETKGKMALAREKLSLGEKRVSLMAKRQKAMPAMPSLMGGFGTPTAKAGYPKPSIMTPAPGMGFGAIEKPAVSVKKKVRRRRRRKKKK